MRLMLIAPLAVLFAACDCNCDKEKQPAKPTSAAAAPAKVEPAPEWKIDEGAEAKPRTPPVVKVAWRGEGANLELSVWEMHCGGCAAKVQEAFAAVPGVKSVEADNETSLVKVTLVDATQRDAVIARLPAALKELNAKADKEFRVLGL
jgi:copper chaperone CopZ